MHTLKVFFILFLSLLTNSRCAKYTPPDYCAIIESDQSNLHSEEKTEEENQISLKKRKETFLNNFDLIIKETVRNGFPNVLEEDKVRDSCKYWAIYATMIHISQTRPDIFYSEEMMNLFSKEINENRMDNSILYTAVKIGSLSKTCDTLKNQVHKSVIAWKIDTTLLDRFKYVQCEE